MLSGRPSSNENQKLTQQEILMNKRFKPVKVSEHSVAKFYKTLLDKTVKS